MCFARLDLYFGSTIANLVKTMASLVGTVASIAKTVEILAESVFNGSKACLRRWPSRRCGGREVGPAGRKPDFPK